MFDSAKIKKAWSIRKEVAKELNCKVTDFVWGICLEMASESTTGKVTIVTDSFGEIEIDCIETTKHGSYIETQGVVVDIKRGRMCSRITLDNGVVISGNPKISLGDFVRKEWSTHVWSDGYKTPAKSEKYSYRVTVK